MRINLNPPSIFSMSTEKLGDIVIFPIKFGSFCDLVDEFCRDFNRITPLEFSKKFMLRTSYPKNIVINNKCPKDFKFESKAENELSEDDVESFAQKYSDHEFSCNEQQPQIKKHEDKDDKYIGKRPDEKYYEYLYRIKANEYKKFQDAMLKTYIPTNAIFAAGSTPALELTKNMQGFSAATKSIMETTFAAGESLKAALNISNTTERFSKIPIPESPQMDIKNISRQQKEFLERPFRPLYEKLEQLNTNSSETVKFISLLNDTQNSIAVDLNESSDQTMVISKKNYNMSVNILYLTIISVIVACASAYFAMTGTSDIDKIAAKNTAVIQTKIDQLIDNEAKLNSQVEALTNIMSKQYKTAPNDQGTQNQK